MKFGGKIPYFLNQALDKFLDFRMLWVHFKDPNCPKTFVLICAHYEYQMKALEIFEF